jgi:hypothetical protein
MQQPQSLAPNTIQPRQGIVLSQLPPAKIVKFSPNKTTLAINEKISIAIEAANVTQATIIESASGTSHGLTGMIKNNVSNNVWKYNYDFVPKGSGKLSLHVNNLTTKDEDSFAITVASPKPTIVEFKPDQTQFAMGARVRFSIEVLNAETISIVDDVMDFVVKSYWVHQGTVDFVVIWDAYPKHTSKLYLKATGKGGVSTSPVVTLLHNDESPLLNEFDPFRNTILGIGTDKATLACRVRGARSVTFFERDPATSDIPSNYREIRQDNLIGLLHVDKFEHLPPRFPWVYRMDTKFWDGTAQTISRTVK